MNDEDLRRLQRSGDLARLDRELERRGLVLQPHDECDSCNGSGWTMGWNGQEDCPRDHEIKGVWVPMRLE